MTLALVAVARSAAKATDAKRPMVAFIVGPLLDIVLRPYRQCTRRQRQAIFIGGIDAAGHDTLRLTEKRNRG
jgi:hypothetical protein